MVNQTVLRRSGEPEEVAAAIAFLASEDASYVTGQTLNVVWRPVDVVMLFRTAHAPSGRPVHARVGTTPHMCGVAHRCMHRWLPKGDVG